MNIYHILALSPLLTLACNADSSESFETANGKLSSFSSPLGTFEAAPDNAEIIAKAKTGTKSLRILGGDNRSVTLKLKTPPTKDVDIKAWGERWASKTPFDFKIFAVTPSGEKQIYDGSKQLRTGGFNTQISAKIPAGTTALKFTSTTPENSGVMLDDIFIVPCIPMQLVGSPKAEIPVIPAMLRSEFNPIVRVSLDTNGALDPITASKLIVDVSGTTQPDQIESLELVGGDESGSPSGLSKERLSLTKKDGNIWTLEGKLPLQPGTNHLWVSAKLKPQASVDGKISILTKEIATSTKTLATGQDKPATQRIGYAVTLPNDKENTSGRVSKSFRIPGLARSTKGTLIGVFDIRYKHSGDLPADVDVGVRRSEDGGQTWDDLKIAMSCKDIFPGELPNNSGCGDPAILVDEKTGRIWIAALWSHGNNSLWGSQVGDNDPHKCGQFMLAYSDDDGKTWSKPVNITNQVKDPQWALYFNGPGSGIQMKDGTLVFPSQHWDNLNPDNKRRGTSSIIYSKDGGATWKTGKGIRLNTSEAQVVQLSDGSLMLNARNEGRNGWRCVYTTTDMGQTWTEHPTNANKDGLREPGACQASIISVPKKGFSTAPLYFSNPDSSAGRKLMTIKTSLDDGKTWNSGVLYDQRSGAGYSSLAPVDDKHVGVLYEGVPGYTYFLKVPYSELLPASK